MLNRLKGILIMFLFFILLGTSSAQTEPPMPFCAELELLPSFWANSEIILRIDTTVCPHYPGIQYRFRREAIRGRSALNVTTEWNASNYIIFAGAEDGEIYRYSAQARRSPTDTSVWSTPYDVLHDIRPPEPCDFLSLSVPADYTIKIVFSRAFDSGSGINEYVIYRAEDSLSLVIIDESDAVVARIPEDGSEIYQFIDDGPFDPVRDLVRDRCYWYTVIPYDNVGFYPASGNIIKDTCAVRVTPTLPPCARLMPISPVTDNVEITLYVDLTVCPQDPVNGTEYRFKVLKLDGTSVIDSSVTPWRRVHYFTFSGDDNTRYAFTAQARHINGLESGWAPYVYTLFDRSGPVAVDSVRAIPQIDGRILVMFWTPGDSLMDRGVGLRAYNLYRIRSDSLEDFVFPITDAHSRFLIHQWMPQGRRVYQFLDDGPGDIIDLINGGCYNYFVIGVDQLGHYSNMLTPGIMAVGCVDKFMAPFKIINLPSWTKGDSVNIRFIDTTHCDAESVEIQVSRYSDFRDAITYGRYGIHDPRLNNPDDHNCADWDTLSFWIHNFTETRYYFRVRGVDTLGNISQWSSVTHTRFDASPPTAAYIDSMKTEADSTNRISISIWWHGGVDLGIGLKNYLLYRSRNREELGELIGTFPTSTRFYKDRSPNPGNYFHNNYYTVITVDSFDYRSTPPPPVGLPDNSPPYPPRIDSITVDDLREKIFVFWSDTAPSGYGIPSLNRYILEHSARFEWFWLGDPRLIDVESPRYSRVCTLNVSVFGGTPYKYFQVKGIDIINNEGGYSMPFYYELPRESTYDFRLDIKAGWNLISLPVYPSDNTLTVLFPGAIGAYTYDTDRRVFTSVTNLEIGKGYFIMFPSDNIIYIRGTKVRGFRAQLSRGWVLVGSCYNDANYMTEPEDALVGPAYVYNPVTRTYEGTSVLKPGRGHWVLSFAERGVLIATPGGIKKEFHCPEPIWRLDIAFSSGAKIVLGSVLGAQKGYDYIYDELIPPFMPDRQLEPFISWDYPMRADFQGTNGNWDIYVPYTTVMKWEPSSVPSTGLFLVSGDRKIDMAKEREATVSGFMRIEAGRLDTKSISIMPNPFNLSTNITVKLDTDAQVSIIVYDITGRQVARVADGRYEKGSTRFRWDGVDAHNKPLPSGFYFVKLVVDGIEKESEKIILLK